MEIVFNIEVLPGSREVKVTGRALAEASVILPASLADHRPSILEAQESIGYAIRLGLYGAHRGAFRALQKTILPLLRPEHTEAWAALIEAGGVFAIRESPVMEEAAE